MSSNDNFAGLSEREKSKLRRLEHQQALILERQEQQLAEERKRFKTEDLSATERADLENRERMVQLSKQLHQIKEESRTGVHYTVGGNDQGVDTLIDTERQHELLNKKHTIRDEFKHRDHVRSDRDLENANMNAILHNNGVEKQNLSAAQTNALFEKINLVLNKAEQIKGNNDDGSNNNNTLQQNDDAAMKGMSEFEKIQYKRKQLPAYQLRTELLKCIRENQVVVIEGETGSGKTTQIMQYLYEDGYCKEGEKMVACTQPRRVAAMSVAARVAVEKGYQLGQEVGYNVRFDNNTSNKTMIKYLTDGMLLRELLTSPDLDRYSVIMIDEAHERTISTDILIGILKPLLKRRSDLKLLIASATINIDKFCKYFNNAPTFKIPGRTCNIDIYHTQYPEADYIDAAITTTMQIHGTQPLNGDILVFLPGQEEIESMNTLLNIRYREHLEKDKKMPELLICPIFANLPADEQAKIFQKTPANKRKVILATNIAETSLTIDGIVYVIDCGWCKTKLTNMTGTSGGTFDALVLTPISKASANQRAGRAGRIRDGKCFRLYTQESYRELPDQNIPEIQRTNLCSVILLLKSLNINDLVNFDFIDPPSTQALAQSLSLLYSLGAIAKDGRLTQTGYIMSLLPLDPMLAKVLIKSDFYQTSHDIIKIAALLNINGNLFYAPSQKANPQVYQQAMRAHRQFYSELGDPFTLLNVYNAYEEEMKEQQLLLKEYQDENNNDSHLSATNKNKEKLNDIKRYIITWCQDNFVQFRLLEQTNKIVEQLHEMVMKDNININYIQHEFNYKNQLKQFDTQLEELNANSGGVGGVNNKQKTTIMNNKKKFLQEYQNKIRLTLLYGYFPNIAKFNGTSNSSNSTYSLLKRPSQLVFVHPTSSLYKQSPSELKQQQRLKTKQQQQTQKEKIVANNNNGGDDDDVDEEEAKWEFQQSQPPPQYIIYHELMRTKKEYIRGCLAIEPEWIPIVAPHYYPTEAREILEQAKFNNHKR